MWLAVGEAVLVSVVVYVGIALMLIGWPPRRPAAALAKPAEELDHMVASGALVEPAAAMHFTARDGASRLYRRYPGRGDDVLVFLHGSSSDGRYLARLATAIAERTGLTVVTPDMRGHGPEPGCRGDVDTIDRQEQDIADMIRSLRAERPGGRFLLGGHSIGAGLAIRYAAGEQRPRPDGMILIAPYIHRSSPAARPNSGGWAAPRVARFAGIEMMHRIGVHAFDRLAVLRFAVPPGACDGTETPLYSWRLFASVTPRADWQAEIARIECPALVLAAERDSIFRPEGYPEIFGRRSNATVEIVPGIDHFQLVTTDEVPARIARWVADRFS